MERPRPTSMSQDLSEALKEATKEVHTQAENAEFMRNFQKGQVTREGFKLVMASLYHVYVALEEEIERNKQNPVYAPLYFPEELHRKAALEQDMAFWYGPRWQKTVPYTPATQHYVHRLHEVGHLHPELLVAHAYTRYLGDLSGGQVLKKIAQKALNLPSSGEGLAFFTFPNVDSPTKFKQLYRARMNTLEMTPEVKHRVIEEAKTAFLLNIELFEELQGLLTQEHQDQGSSQTEGFASGPAAGYKTLPLQRRPEGSASSVLACPRHRSSDGSSLSAFWWQQWRWGFMPCECRCAVNCVQQRAFSREKRPQSPAPWARRPQTPSPLPVFSFLEWREVFAAHLPPVKSPPAGGLNLQTSSPPVPAAEPRRPGQQCCPEPRALDWQQPGSWPLLY